MGLVAVAVVVDCDGVAVDCCFAVVVEVRCFLDIVEVGCFAVVVEVFDDGTHDDGSCVVVVAVFDDRMRCVDGHLV